MPQALRRIFLNRDFLWLRTIAVAFRERLFRAVDGHRGLIYYSVARFAPIFFSLSLYRTGIERSGPPICHWIACLWSHLSSLNRRPGDVLCRGWFGIEISLGRSQKEAAQRIGVDPSTLAKWERGERKPKGNLLCVQRFPQGRGSIGHVTCWVGQG